MTSNKEENVLWYLWATIENYRTYMNSPSVNFIATSIYVIPETLLKIRRTKLGGYLSSL